MSKLNWIGRLAYDFCAAFGFFVLAVGVCVLFLKGGQAQATLEAWWITVPACLWAWLRGEFHHWPNEGGSDD